MRVELVQQAPPQPEPPLMQAHHLDPTTGEDEFANTTYQAEEVIVAPENRNPDDPQTWGKVGRNEACPCGSGKKYKHCHGAFEQV